MTGIVPDLHLILSELLYFFLGLRIGLSPDRATLLDCLYVEFTIIYITIHRSHCTIDEFHTTVLCFSNKLDKLTGSLGLVTLRRLEVNHNQLKCIPDEPNINPS